MEPEGLLPFPQDPATGPYPEPYEFNPHPQTLFSLKSIFCIPIFRCLGCSKESKSEAVCKIS
jgi:hypothetical protein